MHEIGLCESILGAVQQRANGQAVTRVKVRIGARHGVAEASLKQGFSLVATGTSADGAEIDMVVVPIQVSCTACAAQTTTTDLLAICPACGGTDLVMSGGDDLILEELHFAGAEK